MSQKIESPDSTSEASPEAKEEFRKLVFGLVEPGQTIYKNDGSPELKEAEYLLPDGRTMRAYQFLDQEYDTGVCLVFSESGISRDKKPYSQEHLYDVLDYGGTYQSVRALDEQAERRASFHRSLIPGDEEKEIERLVGLDQESLERQWELQGIAQTSGITSISETELQDLIQEVGELQKTNKIELLPPKHPILTTTSQPANPPPSEPYSPIEGAVAAAKSLIYKKELESTEQARPETIQELEQLAKTMTRSGETVWEEPDFGEEPVPSYNSKHYRLVDDREAEICRYLHPTRYEPNVLIVISETGVNKAGDNYKIDKRYYIDQEGQIQLDIQPVDHEDNEPDDQETQEEAEEAAENRYEGLQLGIEMKFYEVSQADLITLIRLLKTAEPVTATQ